MNRRFFVVAVIAFTVAASGCVSGTSNEETPEEDKPVDNITESSTDSADVNRTITVSGGNYYFEPDVINVSVNETIKFVFKNEGGTHDMRIPEFRAGTEVFRGGESQSFTVSFEEKGSYEFICSVGNHAEQGMRGTVEVS